MTREELAAVRDVIDALLRCPDHVRELLTQWIAPASPMARAGSPIKRTDRSFDFLEAQRPRSSSASGRVDGKSVRRN